jgi:hypothetical protein
MSWNSDTDLVRNLYDKLSALVPPILITSLLRELVRIPFKDPHISAKPSRVLSCTTFRRASLFEGVHLGTPENWLTRGLSYAETGERMNG